MRFLALVVLYLRRMQPLGGRASSDAMVVQRVNGDVSMDLSADLAGIIDVSEEEAWLRTQAWQFE